MRSVSFSKFAECFSHFLNYKWYQMAQSVSIIDFGLVIAKWVESCQNSEEYILLKMTVWLDKWPPEFSILPVKICLVREIPVCIYMFKVNNRNTRTWCGICSKLTVKTPERRQASFWCLCC